MNCLFVRDHPTLSLKHLSMYVIGCMYTCKYEIICQSNPYLYLDTHKLIYCTVLKPAVNSLGAWGLSLEGCCNVI